MIEADDAKWSNVPPEDVRKLHLRSDVDSGPRSLHHTLGSRRNQASPGDHIHDGVTSKQLFQTDVELISFVSQSIDTTPVVFPKPYPLGIIPSVFTNIISGAAETARWGSRAISITNTGFTIFVFECDVADPVRTWVDVPVQWLAIT